MNEVIAELQSSSTHNVSAAAEMYGIARSTPWRRWKGLTASRSQTVEKSRVLNDQQAQRPLQHIRDSCDRCLPPTPATVAGTVAQLGGRPPGNNWYSRSVERHRNNLDSRHLDRPDLDKHQANSAAFFEQYFSMTGNKTEEYGILPENT